MLRPCEKAQTIRNRYKEENTVGVESAASAKGRIRVIKRAAASAPCESGTTLVEAEDQSDMSFERGVSSWLKEIEMRKRLEDRRAAEIFFRRAV